MERPEDNLEANDLLCEFESTINEAHRINDGLTDAHNRILPFQGKLFKLREKLKGVLDSGVRRARIVLRKDEIDVLMRAGTDHITIFDKRNGCEVDVFYSPIDTNEIGAKNG